MASLFPPTSHDPATLGQMEQAFERAWAETKRLVGEAPVCAELLRSQIAGRIATAAAQGETDAARLRLFGLGVLTA